MKNYLNKLLKALHLENKQWKSMFFLTIIMNFLYCSLYSIVSLLCNSSIPTIIYYIIQYALYIVLSIIYYLLFTQFIRNRNHDKEKLQWKSFIFPLIKLETIFFLVMEGIALASFYTNIQVSVLRYICFILTILTTFIYFPLRFYGYHQIYYQQTNPFMIFKDGLKVMIKRYVPLFYSWMAMAISFIGCAYLATGNFFEGILGSFDIISLTSNLLKIVNPFMIFYTFMTGYSNISIFSTILSFLFGFILSLAIVLYFSYLINLYDEQ